MKCAIGIFAKTVGLSQVKSRLASETDLTTAEVFYKLSVEAVKEVAQSGARQFDIQPHWALGEQSAPQLPQWESFPSLWTGEGGLGERLANISEMLFETHDMVMFIGTDSPQLSSSIFQDALNILVNNPDDCVCGPAKDGGFYLFASKKPISRDVWESVSYSQSTTLTELKEKSNRHFHDLAVEQDVDHKQDLNTLQKTLSENKATLLPAQHKLLDWLNDYLDVAV